MLSNGPPTPPADRRGPVDPEPLQLGRGDLVAHVERPGDERRLLELLLLDAGELAVLGETAAGRGGLDHRGIDFLPRQRGFDQRLALLEQARTGSVAALKRRRAGAR